MRALLIILGVVIATLFVVIPIIILLVILDVFKDIKAEQETELYVRKNGHDNPNTSSRLK